MATAAFLASSSDALSINWRASANCLRNFGACSCSVDLSVATFCLNGRSWPHTERLAYAQGDSIHWRVVNFTELDHPMHLHGFYFRMDAVGNGVSDSIYTTAEQRMAVTEIIAPFQTMALSWQADRPGKTALTKKPKPTAEDKAARTENLKNVLGGAKLVFD